MVDTNMCILLTCGARVFVIFYLFLERTNMSKLFVLNLFFYLSWTFPLCSLTVSIIIPCHYKHVQHLPELLQHYEHQTEHPEEIVISISEVDKVPMETINAIQNHSYSFKVIVIKHKEKLYAGFNRNSACSKASGDIFICQDADDIPHPQRVEIIKYFFSKYDIKHLIHKCILDSSIKENIDAFMNSYQKENISFALPTFLRTRMLRFHNITNGNIAIKRNVFKKVQWSNIPIGEDVRFNQVVCNNFKKTIVIDAYLLHYRQSLSSWAERFMNYFFM